MKNRPQDFLNSFYKNLNVDKETRELIKFFRGWKKEVQEELNKRKLR